MTKTVFIYALNDPVTGRPRYVGQTPNPKRRLREHISSKSKYHCSRWIQSLRSKNLLPVMEILDQSPPEEADFWEIEYIQLYRALYPRLTNITSGGGGSLGFTPSLETRAKISATLRGKKHSAERCAKNSAALMGRKLSVEHCKKSGAARVGKKLSAEHRANISAGNRGKSKSAEHCAVLSVARNTWSIAHKGEKRAPYKKKEAVL